MRMKKGCLWTLGIGFGLLFVGWLALLILQHTVAAWPDPVPGVRLEPVRPILAEADVKPDNAFYYIRQLRKVDLPTVTKSGNEEKSFLFPGMSPRVVAFNEEQRRWPACGLAGSQYPNMDVWLAANAENLALCQKAADTPKCQMVTALSLDDVFPYLEETRALVKLLCYRAESAAAKGDWRAAACDLRTALVVSSHITRGSTLNGWAVGAGGHAVESAVIRRITLEQNPSPEFLREMDSVLADTGRTQEPLAEAIRYDRLVFGSVPDDTRSTLWSWDLYHICEGRPVSHRFLFWVYEHRLLANTGSSLAETRRHLDGVYSRIIDAVEKNDHAALRLVLKNSREVPILRFLNDPRVQVLCFYGLCNDWILNCFLRERADLDATRVVLAVRRWQLDHGGKLPAALADLVPAYIAAVPEDPFSPKHEPLRYRTDGTAWAVYSVDRDGKDDGGRYSWGDSDDREAHPAELDLVFASDEFLKKRAKYDKAHPKK